MSDDLISRKALLDIFSRNSIFEHITNAEGKNVIQIIEKQPTAYDVDKVVKKLEQEGNNIFSTHFPEDGQEFMDNGISKGFWRSAEIVKSGYEAADKHSNGWIQ